MKTNALLSLLGVLFLVAIALLFVWLWSQTGSFDLQGRRDGLTARLMQRKTVAAMDIRDAVAAEDYSRVARGVAELRRISKASASFLKDARYAAQSDDFRTALDRLDSLVTDRQADGLRDAYTELTDSCVTCHQQAIQSPIDPTLLQPASQPSPGQVDANASAR